MEWKWSIGEKVEKTPRIIVNSQQEEEKTNSNMNDYSEKNAYQQSLLSENDIWNLDGFQFANEDKTLNKREDNYNKISEREMIYQINQNPFLSEQNYLHDLMIQEKFLKPISTSIEKEKNTNYNE